MDLLTNQRMADQISGLYQDLEERLMQNIVKHCKTYDQPIASDVWLARKLAEIGKLNKEHISIIASQSGISQTAMERMLEDTARKAASEMDSGMKQLVKRGLANAAAPETKKSKNVSRVMDSIQSQAQDMLNVCNTTMLYKSRDAFQALVRSIVRDADEIAEKQSFLDILGKNASAAVIGAESRQQVIQKCIREFNEKGIPAFVDKAGREWTPEAYVNMAVRNTIKNTADEVQTARCKDYGIRLIEIDSHSGARPKCAKDQGKIYSLDNKSGSVEDANGKKIKYYPWNKTSYGEPDGILGINCGHHKFPFVPGVSIRRYFPTEDIDANNKLYRETQVQRALERDVRKQKRECMLLDEIGDKDAFDRAAVKLKQKEAKLKSYVNSNEQLHRRKDREQVVGFDERVSSKAVAVKKYVDKYGAVRYNIDGTVIVTDDWKNRGHVSIPKEYRENAIIELKEVKGEHKQINRVFFDSEGKMYRQTHSGHHANPKQHQYGKNGEHAHDIEWKDGEIVNRITRELTDAERRESGDIL